MKTSEIKSCKHLKRLLASLWGVCFLGGFAGCAPPAFFALPAQSPQVQSCRQFMASVDRAVANHEVLAGAEHKLPGFPYLRSTRYLSAVRPETAVQGSFDEWVTAMQALDLNARRLETDALPLEAVGTLLGEKESAKGRGGLWARIEHCSEVLLQSDREQGDFAQSLARVAAVPDEYRLGLRVAGLYPLSSLPVAYLTLRAQNQFQRWHAAPVEELPVAGRKVAFVPAPGSDESLPENFCLPAASAQVTLPLSQGQALANAFAPVFVQDVAGAYDAIGAVEWSEGKLRVDTSVPTVYYYFSRIFYRGRPVWQINYVVWYGARAGPGSPWIERGALDGLTVRVSLDAQRVPFMVDYMNNCGCYHAFVPRRERVAEVVRRPFSLDPFVATWLPDGYPKKSLTLHINSGWHQVEQVGAEPDGFARKSYRLVPYGELESLPCENGLRRSMFSPAGIAWGSERIEPWILFPMGVPEVGAMRQRGRHPIRLIGRSHFDDPELFDRNFRFY